MTLNPNKVDTYRGDPDFTVEIVGFPSLIINGEERYEPEVTWSSNVVQETNQLVTTFKDDNDIQIISSLKVLKTFFLNISSNLFGQHLCQPLLHFLNRISNS